MGKPVVAGQNHGLWWRGMLLRHPSATFFVRRNGWPLLRSTLDLCQRSGNLGATKLSNGWVLLFSTLGRLTLTSCFVQIIWFDDPSCFHSQPIHRICTPPTAPNQRHVHDQRCKRTAQGNPEPAETAPILAANVWNNPFGSSCLGLPLSSGIRPGRVPEQSQRSVCGKLLNATLSVGTRIGCNFAHGRSCLHQHDNGLNRFESKFASAFSINVPILEDHFTDFRS